MECNMSSDPSATRSSISDTPSTQNDESVMESDEMDDYHQDSAINLSNSSQRICNGIDFPDTEKSEINCHSTTAAFGGSPPLKAAELAGKLMPAGLQHLFQQHMAPPQLHQLLQQQQLAEVSRHQLHDSARQVQEQLAEVSRHQLHDSARQVQEQLHLALLQQNQGVSEKNKTGSLSIHPSQLMQQVQMLQRQYLLNQAGIAPNSIPGLAENNNISMWDKSISEPPHSPPSYLSSRSPALTNGGPARGDTRLTNGNGDVDAGDGEGEQSVRVSALFHNGICNWPGCETPCDKFSSFLKHLSTEHTLDDRSTAHARVQMQVVQQMENNLSKEKARLDAMMAHLHMNRSQVAERQPVPAPAAQYKTEPATSTALTQSEAGMCDGVFASSSTPVSSVVPFNPFLRSAIIHGPSLQHSAAPIRRRHADKPMTTGPYDDNSTQQRRRVADRSGQDITEELSRNRDFYCNTDIRPPFTYASLIRQAIVESPDRQLTLNEIYSWFQATFAYFRRNAATWKNAVRHNLSLHKCFARVENVKGAVWTVDEAEFCKRRSQRTTGPSRSPTLSNSPTALYGDCLNLSLPSALGDVKMPFMVGASDRLRDTPTLLQLPRTSCDSPPLSPVRPASEGGSVTPAGLYSPGLLAKREFDSISSPPHTEHNNNTEVSDPERRSSLEHNAEDLRLPTVKVEYDEGEHPLPTSAPA